MSRRTAPVLAVTICLGALSGCYQGEWRLGTEVPVASTTRLTPTRDIERWELQQSMTPNVVQIKGTVTPRCRYVLYGSSRRTDTGQFKRVGGGYWTALAIVTGATGGALGGFGASGWFSQLYPDWGKSVMYGTGGALAAGGLAACISSIASPSKIRLALCGIMVGLGGSVLVGAALSNYPNTGSSGGMAGNTLFDQKTFQTMAIAGGALVGAAIVSGLISASWRDFVERERVVDIENAQTWDAQTTEQNCGGQRSITGKVANLEVTAENLTEGLGSDGSPMRIRVAMTGQSIQAVDLRGLRNAIPSCGDLRVRLAPEILYDDAAMVDDYMPPMQPAEVNAINRPIHAIVMPREGIVLAGPQTARKPTGIRSPVPGISLDVLNTLEKRCRGETGESATSTASSNGNGERKPHKTRPPRETVRERNPEPPSESSDPPRTTTVEPPTVTQPAPSLTPSRTPLSQPEVSECSAESQQARFADCEHQCGRALELSTCLFDFRKCHIAARGSAQPQKERDACDLTWEQCLFKTNVAPGSWRRCVDGCVQANEPTACHSSR